mmetsp:Transcript_86/g.208  ORF Transcript_86/g.208 Transcript_86/m.208 type:complete len:401 (+) Transcript_86:110-1312(+)
MEDHVKVVFDIDNWRSRNSASGDKEKALGRMMYLELTSGKKAYVLFVTYEEAGSDLKAEQLMYKFMKPLLEHVKNVEMKQGYQVHAENSKFSLFLYASDLKRFEKKKYKGIEKRLGVAPVNLDRKKAVQEDGMTKLVYDVGDKAEKTPEQELVHNQRVVTDFWAKDENRQGLAAWWERKPVAERISFLSDVVRGIPYSAQNPFDVEGLSAEGVLHLLPDINLETMCISDNGAKLYKVFEKASVVHTEASMLEQNKSLATYFRTVFDVLSPLVPSDRNEYVDLLEPKESLYDHKRIHATKLSTLQKGRLSENTLVPSGIYNLVQFHRTIQLNMLLAFIVEYRQDTYIPKGKCALPACENSTRPDGAPLSACAKCKTATYCSRDHQVAHWKVHKRVCKQLTS